LNPLASTAGILASIIVACLIGLAGGDTGTDLLGIPLFLFCGLLAFMVQWIMFIPAWIYRTEKYFDLTGSLTYITLALIALTSTGFENTRAIVIAMIVLIWAARLGSFLFVRVSKDGGDRRFVRIKTNFMQFLMTWTIQGLWVYITFAAGLAAMTSSQIVAPDIFLVIGLLCWIAGFAIEVTADHQKSAFRSHEENRGRFITTGLWAYSRHPNYFGEILLWCGVAIIAFPALEGWQLATMISPVFVIVLLTRISGVNLLEARAAKKWGDDPEYRSYLERTPVLIPRISTG
jgi:steroid 5-alpha reductase family enzyme